MEEGGSRRVGGDCWAVAAGTETRRRVWRAEEAAEDQQRDKRGLLGRFGGKVKKAEMRKR